MEPSQISLNKVTLNVSSPKDGGVSLNKGEMVKGTVQEVRPDGLVMIVIKGKLVEAVAEVPVKPGQELYLMVDDFRNGKTYLKLVSPEMMGKIENANIKANLQQMGITAKEETVLLASKLVQHNLPVTPDSLNELARVVKLIGGSNPRNLEIAAFALSRGIVTREALTALASFLAPETNKAQLMTVLNRLLNILTIQLTPSLSAETLPLQMSSTSAIPSALNIAAESVLSGNIPTASTIVASGPESLLSSVKGEAAPIASNAQETVAATPVKGEVAQSATPTASGRGELTQQAASLSPEGAPVAPVKAEPVSLALNIAKEVAAANQVKSEAALTASGRGELASQATSVSLEGTPAAPLKADPVLIASNTAKEMVNPNQGKGEPTATNTSLNQETVLAAPVKGEAASHASNAAPGTNTVSPARDVSTGIYQHILPDGEAEVPAQNAARATGSETQRVMMENLLKLLPASAGTAEPDGNVALKTGETDRSQVLSGQTPLVQTHNDSGLPQDNLTQRVVNLLQTLVDIVELDLATSPDKIAEKIQNSTQSEREIIKALLLLEDLTSDQRVGDKIGSVKDFSLRLENMEKEISGQRLFNLSSRTPGENITSYYFSFPVKMDNGYSMCQLKINKDSRQKLKDLDNLNFVVSLNTSKLGIVLFHVNWHRQGTLKLQGVVESQSTCNYMNKNIGELVAKLQGLGFKVSNLGVKVSISPVEINCVKPVFEDVSQKIRPLGIDVTV
ncbi:MAG: hypothetical protein CVU90_11670 [Firmicutes bacterium HGW-Firmicutes-15]|nr:MAG: hypothetical protein CVU90_11670 [Firmicutes bacterium HGW-Firmicutes-15]